MTTQDTLLPEPGLAELVQGMVRSLLSQPIQPSAAELLARAEQTLGWAARWEMQEVLSGLAVDTRLNGAVRNYVSAMLESGDLDEALRGGPGPAREIVSTIDALVQQSKVYRNSEAFREMVDFMGRFRDYAPFNNMLVRVQNPSCSFYATAKDWRYRFERQLIEDARPLLILAPMHPVMLVYDLDQTEGKPVPKELLEFSAVKGECNPLWLSHLVASAEGHRIKVDFKELSSTNAGFATSRASGGWKMRVAIDQRLDQASRLGVLCHELAHILLGHLGTDRDLWWPSRSNLTQRTVEIEAESAAHIVLTRLGLRGSSAEYLSRHLKGNELPPSVSIDLIAKVAGHLEKMVQTKMPPRKPRPETKKRNAS
jgi:hypothetical protein